MLKKWRGAERAEREEEKRRLLLAKEMLQQQQIQIKENAIPVLILVEGWGTAGKGECIRRVLKHMDSRFFQVIAGGRQKEEKRKSFFSCYADRIPEAGTCLFLDSGWMGETVGEYLRGRISEKDYAMRVKSVLCLERQLTDNGYLVMKFFLHISKNEQKRRIEKLSENRNTKWRVTKKDRWQNQHYEICKNAFERYLKETDTPFAPWHMIDAASAEEMELQVMEYLTEGIAVALKNHSLPVLLQQNIFPLVKMPHLSEVSLDQSMEKGDYKRELKRLQKRLEKLQNLLYRKKIPFIIVYEGWDAAGKGGNIRRITEVLDPRGYDVYPIVAPKSYETERYYLWRFFQKLPKTGHMAIFDRSWYGRVLVERVEELCSENEWMRAYQEINEFEKALCDWGAVILKFWVQIDRDTQLIRFRERQNTPQKQWKITEEDWRNREKWEQYEEAADEMLQKTSTTYAPWYILESVDKRYARIKALKIVIRELEKVLLSGQQKNGIGNEKACGVKQDS